MRRNASAGAMRLDAVRRVGVASGFAVALYALRVVRTGELTFGFLVWNLALALVPFALALPKRGGLPRSIAWLLFFPNAPYIITDLIHLRPRGVPYWYDVLLLASFAWAGLVSGWISLEKMHARVQRRHGVRIGWAFVGVVALLSGLGIWLGRFVRLNSWDVITNPTGLLDALLPLVVHPIQSVHAWGVSVLFGSFVLVVYATTTRLHIPRRRPEMADPTNKATWSCKA